MGHDIRKHIASPSGDGNSVPVSHALPSLENVRSIRPFQIVSLLDMFRFFPVQLLTSLAYLQSAASVMTTEEAPEKLKGVPTETDSRHATDALTGLKEICDKSGMETSSSLIDHALSMITPAEKWTPSIDYVAAQLEGVSNTLMAEMRGIIFLRISKNEEEHYKGESLFGDEVSAKFSDAKYDITESGKCLALGRDTACVLHLMRVLELGLNSLASHFQVPFEHTNWNQVIEQVEAKIKAIDKDPNKPATWKDDRKFFSAAANQFRYFKDSWRNYAMHIHDKYTPEEALIVYTSVKVFMQQISGRLSQP